MRRAALLRSSGAGVAPPVVAVKLSVTASTPDGSCHAPALESAEDYDQEEEDYEASSDSDSLHFSNSVSTFFKNLNCLKDR